MTDVLDRIQKLIALALKNPSEEEARSAALKALRLMETHQVRLSLPAAAPTATPAPGTDPYADFLRVMRKDAAWSARREAAYDIWNKRDPSPWYEPK